MRKPSLGRHGAQSITLLKDSGEDTDARSEALIEAGEKTDRDLFVIIRWLEPQHHRI
ncbi:hypothetical protein [Bosea beijingensis]